MQNKKLEEIFLFIRNGASIKQEAGRSGLPISRIETIANGTIDMSRVGFADIYDENKYSDYLLQKGDILMSHINSTSHLGKTAIFESAQKLIHGMNLLCLRPDAQIAYYKYVFYYLNSIYFKMQIPQITKNSVNQSSFTVSSLKKLAVPLPSLETQKKVAAVLDKAQELIDKRKEQLAKLDEFVQSVFWEMFGDPILNPREWPVEKLENIAEVISGVTKGRKLNSESLVSIPYMRVANVQDGHLVLDVIKEIEVLPTDVEKYMLKFGDLLMTEGGDPDKLGRGAIWKNEISECIHQNHIFRVRLNQSYLLPEYTCFLVGSTYGKKYFLRASKQTTGIATINSTQLKMFPIYMPPLDLQNKFAAIVEKTEQQKALMQQSLTEMENNFNSLMQQAFKGELF